MRIECPDCGARYEVSDSRLAPGRSVRCARCARDWTPVPTDVVSLLAVQPPAASAFAEQEPASPPAPEEPLRRPHPFVLAARPNDPVGDVPQRDVLPFADMPPRRSKTLLAAWVVSVMVVAAALASAVILRDPIARAWPPSLRIYEVLRLPVDD